MRTQSLVDVVGKRLSTATVLFHTAVAERMGVSVTDAKCHSLLLQHGPLTAGDLATRVGLTTGAVTGVIDRLVAARLAERVADKSDRRRVIVRPVMTPTRRRALAQLFDPMGKRIRKLVAAYTPSEQALLGEFLTQACEVLEDETTRLRAERLTWLMQPCFAGGFRLSRRGKKSD